MLIRSISFISCLCLQVIWNCLVDDCGLFLRYILERLTRERSELEAMFKILRHLIRFVPKLPQQAAFSLYNYIIGYVMYYVRSPHEDGQKMIGAALSVLWMVIGFPIKFELLHHSHHTILCDTIRHAIKNNP